VIPTTERSRLPVAFIAGLVIVTLLIGAAMLISKYSTPSEGIETKPLAMGLTEQTYAPQIHFLDPKMSRAANFLNQEVTFVFGTLDNTGKRRIKQIEITLEFHDPFGQVVLRDKQRLLTKYDAPIGAGQQHDFQVPYEHVSAEWNNGYPTIKVTGLDLD
jgi:hypothetical protein